MQTLPLISVLFALAIVSECDNNLEETYSTKILQPYLTAAKDAAYFIGLVKKQSQMGPSYQVDLSQLPVDTLNAFLRDLEPHVRAFQKLSTAVDEVSEYGTEVVHDIQSKIADLDEKTDKLEKDLVRAESELKGNKSLLTEHQTALNATYEEYKMANGVLRHAETEAQRDRLWCFRGKRKRDFWDDIINFGEKIKKFFEKDVKGFFEKDVKNFFENDVNGFFDEIPRKFQNYICEAWNILSGKGDWNWDNVHAKLAVRKQKEAEAEQLSKKVEALHTIQVGIQSEIAKIKAQKNATDEESEKVNKRLDSVHKVHARVKTHQKDINELAIKLDAMKDNGKLELLLSGLNEMTSAMRDVGDEVISTIDEGQKKELRENLENLKISFL